MKNIILLFSIIFFFSNSNFAQKTVSEITWDELTIEKYEKKFSETLQTEVKKPVFSKKQKALDSTEVIIAGNYHVLNNFDSKTHLISRDEIIKTPMKLDEIMIIELDESSKIYFGKKAQVKGTLILNREDDAESHYKLINAESVNSKIKK
jgi:hypothetical protein